MILSRVTEGTGPVKSGNLRMQGAKSCGIYRKMSKHGTFRKNGAYFFGRSFLNG